MAYNPINPTLYSAVYSGALSGMAVSGKYITDIQASAYNDFANVAGAFAQAVDRRSGPLGTLSVLDLQSALLTSKGLWESRAPIVNQTVTNYLTYSDIAEAFITLLRISRTYFINQGIPPPPVPGTSSENVVTVIATSPISGHRVVKLNDFISYCDADAIADSKSLLGITLNAGDSGDPVQVQTAYRIDEPSWTWIQGNPIYCGSNGVLTQSYSNSWAWVGVLGFAITPTSLWLRTQPPILQ